MLNWKEKIPAERRRELVQRWRRLLRPAWLGTVRTTHPVSDGWGFDRGMPVDRYYIERFLEGHRSDIHGCVLEIKDNDYTNRFGVGVERSEVLDINAHNPQATIIGDLAADNALPPNTFDCFILTQTLQFIYDTRAVLAQAHRCLRPEGVLLVTVPTLSKLDRRLTDYWRFTPASCALLFGEVFGADNVNIESFGNVLTAVSFLLGMAKQELVQRELDEVDKFFPVIIGVRAVKR